MNTNLESIIPLLNKNLKIIQRSDYFNFSIDSLLISEFVNIQKNTKKILDLGTGNAAIPLFLSKKTSAKIYGIEIQEISYKLALRNININDLNEQIYIIYDNMKNYLNYFNMGSFDIVISNPPFFRINENTNFLNNLKQLSIARHEIEINLEELIKIASELVKDRGYFYLVHRADRLSEILNNLIKYRFEAKKIKFCYTTKYKNAKIVLIEAIKNGKPGLTILPPLIINKENGEYTDEVLKMFE
ncbi:tRNA1(Val) (adenine(37)-N6)-methyltransferase [Fusobacterium hwasookii]|uniref:Methyltransferase n=1 Tax=Fusobacterium hwasookii ChDC F128 TaxID=1216362 RepID=A0ABP2R6D4_9FUSO|nr:tRNA1(Val) (adenine(37)-N6)-methyltransferase [Fusobacterium hwasookii]EJU08520.1 methyltransferase [Fusobacterium hwasookii ChDC F128]QNE67195.1 tRNA1(Val) (adenine(37)-N6)-methyltransferase [Fusobacterium hwasookii]QYR54886.1 tRNA1(Val) (adenine(37)-N6)-methyltransferase [Fusobacterium hwasookii]